MEDAHMKTVDEVQNYFGTDPERGLSADQVKRNQEKYGPNGKPPFSDEHNICTRYRTTKPPSHIYQENN